MKAKKKDKKPAKLETVVQELQQALDHANDEARNLRTAVLVAEQQKNELAQTATRYEKQIAELNSLIDKERQKAQDASRDRALAEEESNQRGREIATLKMQAAGQQETLMRIEEFRRARKEGQDLHSAATKENTRLRQEKSNMKLSLMEVLADLDAAQDAMAVNQATGKLRSVVELG